MKCVYDNIGVGKAVDHGKFFDANGMTRLYRT
jgi:hypothetical protein